MKSMISGKPNSKIPYMDKPPAMGGQLEYLSPQQFLEKFNCAYFEGIKVSDKNFKSITKQSLTSKLAKAAFERLQNPLDCLVICKMSDNVGHGLFTLEDIPLGTIICIYSGIDDPKGKEFIYSCSDTNASKVGGMSRFMQHLPLASDTYLNYQLQTLQDSQLFSLTNNLTEEEARQQLQNEKFIKEKAEAYRRGIKEANAIDKADFNFDAIKFNGDKIKQQSADSNVELCHVTINNIEVVVMLAMRDIKKQEIIGFSYGPAYFEHPTIRKSPRLFTKQGEVIPSQDYIYDYFVPTWIKDLRRHRIERAILSDPILEKLNSVGATPATTFNQNKAIEYINNALGKAFFNTYIHSGRGNWHIEEKKGSFSAKLEGLQIAKQSDCEWYRGKLIKGGLKREDIHFDAIKGVKGAADKYQIRLTNIQRLQDQRNLLQQQEKTNYNFDLHL